MISVVIPTLDEERALPATLAALAAQRDAPPWEAILADGGSRDRTLALFETSVPAGRVVPCAARGRASVRNAAMLCLM